MVFPKQESLKMMSKSTSFTLPLNQLVVSVKEAADAARSFGSLVNACVLLDDVPDVMRNKSCLMAFAELIGKPISIDEESLSRLGPCSVTDLVPGSYHARGFIEVFPASKAYRINVRVEGQAASQAPRAASPPPHEDQNNEGSMDGDESGPPFSKQEWMLLGLSCS